MKGGSSSRLRPILSIAFFIWIAAVLATYYVVQKPISPQDGPAIAAALAAFQGELTLSAPAEAILNVLTAAAIGFAALLAGARVMPLPYPGAGSPVSMRAEYWLLSTGLGFGLSAIAMLLLALAGVLSPVLMEVAAVLLLVITRRALWPQLLTDFRQMASVRLPRALRIFLLVSLALGLLSALAPPTAFDALSYHLTVPQRVLLAGRLLPFGDIIPPEDYPMLMSSLYLLAMLLRGDVAAQCIHFIFGLMTLGLIALTAREFCSRAAVPVALAITLSIPIVLLLSSWAYSDIALTFYTLAAVVAYHRWLAERGQGYLILAGLMAGFALGLKYTSFLLPLGLAAFLLHDARQSRVRDIAVFVLACAAAAAPWYLKNWWFTGNPVYPFVFGGPQWDDLRAVWWARPGTGIGLDFVELLRLPLDIALGARDQNFIDGRIGPLILLLLPLLLVRRPRIDRFLTLFLLYYAAWVAGVVSSQPLWQARYLLPALVLLVPPLAQAVTQLKEFDLPSFSLLRLTKLVIALVLGFALWTQALEFVKFNPVAFIAGAETREQFVVRQTGNYALAMAAVSQLPANARVQFLWEGRSYLAQRAVRADLLLDALPHLVATTGSVEESVRRLKSEGFTHVLVWEAYVSYTNDNLHDQTSERDAENLRQLESDYARLVYENSAYRLLELK
jgi:4-amino-4-deoxy-L-arabinose transferase-like glycosyltransferase